MLNTTARTNLLQAYGDAGSFPPRVIGDFGAALGLLIAVFAVAPNLDRGEAAIGSEASKGRLVVESSSLSSARETFDSRRVATINESPDGKTRLIARR